MEVNGSTTSNTVRKTPTKQKPEPADEPSPVTTTKAPSKAKTAATRPAKSAAKTRGAKSKSTAGAKGVRKQPPKPKVTSPMAAEPTDSEIQLRAYFLAEKRLQHGLPGDSAHDWLEAKRQLLEEAAQPRT